MNVKIISNLCLLLFVDLHFSCVTPCQKLQNFIFSHEYLERRRSHPVMRPRVSNKPRQSTLDPLISTDWSLKSGASGMKNGAGRKINTQTRSSLDPGRFHSSFFFKVDQEFKKKKKKIS